MVRSRQQKEDILNLDNIKAIELVERWQEEDSDYDKKIWPQVKKILTDIDLKEKALEVIQVICENESHEHGDKTLDLIYRLAHCASDTECVHTSWQQELEELHETLVKAKLL